MRFNSPNGGPTTAQRPASPPSLSEEEEELVGEDGDEQSSMGINEEAADYQQGVGGRPYEVKMGGFLGMLVGVSAISGLLFGYDTGVISGTLVVISSDLGHVLSNVEKEIITSSTTLGALLGGLASGALSDYTGRKPVIALASTVFVLGALGQAICRTVSMMVFGRFVVGIGVGLASCIVPLYIGELAPKEVRGRLVTLNVVAITLGQVLAYAVGAGFQHAPGGWRWMVGLGAVPGAIQLASLTYLPESRESGQAQLSARGGLTSARILLLRGRVEQAQDVIARIYPSSLPGEVAKQVEEIRLSVRQSTRLLESTTWRERLQSLLKDGPNRRALIIGCGLQALQQLCGFNTLMYYSASLFKSLGFDNPTAVGGLIALVNFLFTLVALRIVDPLGRRRTMLLTVPIMVVALLLASFFFRRLTAASGGVLVDSLPYSRSLATAVVLSMMLYVSGYAIGVGNVPWQQGELFRLEVRGLGSSISTGVNWTGNLLVASTFLSLMDVATPAGAFMLYALLCAAGWVFCFYLYPETAGLSLEEVYELFSDDFGVSKSAAIRRDRLRIPA